MKLCGTENMTLMTLTFTEKHNRQKLENVQ
jgi:hypothetical protein